MRLLRRLRCWLWEAKQRTTWRLFGYRRFGARDARKMLEIIDGPGFARIDLSKPEKGCHG